MRSYFRMFKECSDFFLSQENQLWAYSNHSKWLWYSTPHVYSLCNFLKVCRGKINLQYPIHSYMLHDFPFKVYFIFFENVIN